MTSAEGELYVEAIAANIKKIELRLETIRYENAQKVSRSRDKTAEAALSGVIPFVEILVDGEKTRINNPELWLQTFKLALVRYKERFGSDAGLTISNRYLRGWNVEKVYVQQFISKRLYQDRRSRFLVMFLLYAVQNKLLVVE